MKPSSIDITPSFAQTSTCDAPYRTSPPRQFALTAHAPDCVPSDGCHQTVPDAGGDEGGSDGGGDGGGGDGGEEKAAAEKAVERVRAAMAEAKAEEMAAAMAAAMAGCEDHKGCQYTNGRSRSDLSCRKHAA